VCCVKAAQECRVASWGRRRTQGQGLGGSNATCFTLNSAGGVTFACRDCAASSASPFASASVLRFAVKSQAGGSSAAVPNLRVRAGPCSPNLKACRAGACKKLEGCARCSQSALCSRMQRRRDEQQHTVCCAVGAPWHVHAIRHQRGPECLKSAAFS